EPGAGDTQAPRQAAPDTGPDEGGRITTFEQRDGEWVWPNVADFAALELVPDDAKGGQVR
ncbi:MAG TPA: hypothetical protein PKA64_24225, partial [Myxococcota bacterium]|nr:hypothetical protein [Myxococcota bacterium]